MKFKNNIWTVFYFILFFAVGIFAVLSLLKYYDIKDEYYSENEYLTQVVAQTTDAMLTQYEVMLEVLGEQLVEHNNYKNKKRTAFLFDRLLRKNPSLMGFGLINLDGTLINVSSNIDIRKIQNLKSNPRSCYSFEATLKSTNMVVGRTYFVEGIGAWITPLRMTIYDEMLRPIAVMTTALKISRKEGLFKKINLKSYTNIMLVKDIDQDNHMYRLYYDKITKESKHDVFEKPISKEFTRKVSEDIAQKYAKTLDEVRQSSLPISLGIKDFFGDEKLATFVYNQRYEIWVIVQQPADIWFSEFIRLFLVYLFIFILFVLVIYTLFNYISNADKKKKKELVFQATHDNLTQLPNRNYIKKNIDKWKKKFGYSFDILFIDLDNFKNINDRFGHHIGDEILIEVATRYGAFFDENSLVIRHGGDEFIVLLPSMKEDEKKVMMNALLALIAQPYVINGLEFNIGSSIGTAHYPNDTDDFNELMSLADIAMYEAKKVKNSYCIFSETMREKSIFKAEVENELRHALEKNEISMVYQPQVKSDGSLYGVEALVRWNNEKLGFVPPDKFIEVAEETGMMKDLGAFIISCSLEEIKAIQTRLDRAFQLSINISVRQLMEVGFIEHLLAQLKNLNFKPEALTLEITESLFIEDMEYVLPLLAQVKEEGIQLSLDDFGTGYSSLSILRKLPINELKIDKSFIDEILNKKEDSALVESIIRMGQNMSMSVLAEGTETAEQVQKLKEFNCDLFQGYYFSRPLTKIDLNTYLLK